MRPALFWDFTQCTLVVCYRRFGKPIGSHLQRSWALFPFFSLSISRTVFSLLPFFLLPYISLSYTWKWLHIPGRFYLRAPLGNTLSSSFTSFTLYYPYWLALPSLRTKFLPHRSLYDCVPKCCQHFYQRLEKHHDDFRDRRTALPQASTSTAVRQADPLGRNITLSWW